MKINSPIHAREKGSVFLVAMGLAVLFSLILGSYLTLVQGEAAAVARSQSYNMAIPVAEAGVEEALALLNKNGGASSWSNTLASDGWGAITSSNTTTKSNLVYASSYYQVTISNTSSNQPTIISAGVVPFIQYTWGILMDTNRSENITTVALVRTIQIQITNTASTYFSSALASEQSMNFSGGIVVDSFNSASTTYSLNGQYSSSKVDDKAIVGTTNTAAASITISGGGKIRGYVNTGPGGTVNANNGASVGDNAWVSRSNNNFNVSFTDIAAPTATFVETPASGTVNGTNYAMVFEGNNYWGTSNVMYQTSLNLNNVQEAIITNGNVTIYVPSSGTFAIAGSAFLYIAPGSSLTVYCGAPTATLSGASFVGATNAQQMTLLGLPTLTSIVYGGGTAFMGGIVAQSISFSGSATLHYDENIVNSSSSSGVAGGYAATSWREIATPAAYQSLPP